MDFIYDDGPHRLQQAPAFLGRQQNEQRLRRGDENMRRTPEHLLPFGHRRVARADQDTQLRHQQTGRKAAWPISASGCCRFF